MGNRLILGWLGIDTKYLDSSVPLTATGIVEAILDINLSVQGSCYGKLLGFLEKDLSYQRDDNLFPFYYDWRVAVGKASMQLVQKIRAVQAAKPGEQVIIFSHSLGCLVARHALNSKDLQGNFYISSQEVAALIEIALPIQGASTAFGATQYPEKFSREIESLLNGFSSLPTQRDSLEKNIRETLFSFESIFELFPPDSDPILQDERGQLYSALGWPGWNSSSGATAHVQSAQRFHSVGRVVAAPAPQNIPVYVLYNNDEPQTDRLYEFTSVPPYTVKKDALLPLDGDSRIVESSCLYNTNEPNVTYQQIVLQPYEPKVDEIHYWLPAMEATKDWLRVNVPRL